MKYDFMSCAVAVPDAPEFHKVNKRLLRGLNFQVETAEDTRQFVYDDLSNRMAINVINSFPGLRGKHRDTFAEMVGGTIETIRLNHEMMVYSLGSTGRTPKESVHKNLMTTRDSIRACFQEAVPLFTIAVQSYGYKELQWYRLRHGL